MKLNDNVECTKHDRMTINNVRNENLCNFLCMKNNNNSVSCTQKIQQEKPKVYSITHTQQ